CPHISEAWRPVPLKIVRDLRPPGKWLDLVRHYFSITFSSSLRKEEQGIVRPINGDLVQEPVRSQGLLEHLSTGF
ncbi:hypothetical protein ACQP3D_28355, partial [Escherichia coli]